MSALFDYVQRHTKPSGDPLQTGQWDVVELVEKPVDMYFFRVFPFGNPTVEDFIRLTNEHQGAFCDLNPLDGDEHNYIELGAWIGDQGMAIRYMALGNMLGLWETMDPGRILDINDPEQKSLANLMAGQGFVSILPKKS